METNAEECTCLTPPLNHRDFETRYVGDDANYGEVRVEICRTCGRCWLVYFYENEAFSQSGRWFRGVIPLEQASTITPDQALQVLNSLEWHLRGGPYFMATRRSPGPLPPWGPC